MLRAAPFLFVVLLCSTYASGEINVDKIRKQLAGILKDPSVPPNIAKVVGMLHDSIHILRCIPTRKHGNCYYSPVCRLPEFKVDGTIIPVIIGFCKRPYKITITPDTYTLKNALVPRFLRPIVGHNIGTIVINFKDNHRDGLLTIDSDHTFKGGLGRGRTRLFDVYKVKFFVKGTLRYDCTKPRAFTPLGGTIFAKGDYTAMRRCNLNSRAPLGKNNKMYYNIQVRHEFKMKKFNWGKLNYECFKNKCKDMVNKKGVFGYSGPQACITDVRKGCSRFMDFDSKCGQSWQPPCP